VASHQRSTRVYHVEDSVEVRVRISSELERLDGIELVGFAECSTEAIAGIRQGRPDVIVLDLDLREGSGLDVLRALRNDHPRPLIIVLTNQSDPTARQRSIQAGAHHYFDKSTEFPQFLACLQMSAKQLHD
jgi:two-component system OmpR family response regulator